MSKSALGADARVALAERDALRLVWSECTSQVATSYTLSPERLFEALDGRMISVRGQDWLVEIFSVRAEARATFLQIALHGTPSFTMLMRLAPDEGPKHAARILASWLTNRADRTHILNVA